MFVCLLTDLERGMCKATEESKWPWTSEHGTEPHVSAEDSLLLLSSPHQGIDHRGIWYSPNYLPIVMVPTREIWYSPIYLLIVMVPTREIWLTDCNISTREWFCSPPKPAEWNAFGILSTLHWHFNDFSRPIRACHPPHFATLRVVPTASPAFLPSSPLPSLSLRLW